MKPVTFAEIINDLPDDIIESAAEPHSKSIRWYHISAIAACFVIGVTAVVYPKLKVQPPEILEPMVTSETTLTTITTESKALPVVITETSESVLTTTALSTVSTIGTKTTPSSVTSLTSETSLFTKTERDTTISSAASAETTKRTKTTFVSESQTTAPPYHPETTASVSTTNTENTVTEAPAYTTAETAKSSINEITTPAVTNPVAIVPVWKYEAIPCISPEPGEQPFSEAHCKILSGDDLAKWKEFNNITYDFNDYACLQITIDTNYSNAVITDIYFLEGKITPSVSYPETQSARHGIQFYIPVLNNLLRDTQGQSDAYDICITETVLSETDFQKLSSENCNLI